MSSHSLRHACCNEAFEKWDFAEACRALKKIGYAGIEIAPFTLAEKPSDVTAERRREVRGIIANEGLEFVGLHWLMVSPKGLHVTSPDAELRRRGWDHIRDLIDLCGDLGGKAAGNGVLVFGSPNQRRTTGGLSRAEATQHMEDGLAAAAPHAQSRGVVVLLEALPIGQCDVVQTLGEAVEIVERIGSPAIQTMFDVHNAVDEVETHTSLVEKHYRHIRHVHVNEIDGSHCGARDYDFHPLLETLRRLKYPGWVSLEAFDFSVGAERLAAESLRHLENL